MDFIPFIAFMLIVGLSFINKEKKPQAKKTFKPQFSRTSQPKDMAHSANPILQEFQDIFQENRNQPDEEIVANKHSQKQKKNKQKKNKVDHVHQQPDIHSQLSRVQPRHSTILSEEEEEIRLQTPTEARRAFIYSEIFRRKYD